MNASFEIVNDNYTIYISKIDDLQYACARKLMSE